MSGILGTEEDHVQQVHLQIFSILTKICNKKSRNFQSINNCTYKTLLRLE